MPYSGLQWLIALIAAYTAHPLPKKSSRQQKKVRPRGSRGQQHKAQVLAVSCATIAWHSFSVHLHISVTIDFSRHTFTTSTHRFDAIAFGFADSTPYPTRRCATQTGPTDRPTRCRFDLHSTSRACVTAIARLPLAGPFGPYGCLG